MKAMQFFLATSAAITFAVSACQKNDSSLSTPEQAGVVGNPAQDNTFSQGADQVRWDIISLNTSTTPASVSAGGVAYAKAYDGGVLSNKRIKFTGSGTFVAPANGGGSSAVSGGGSWETFSGNVSTGSGTYEVTKLADWEFASLQLPVITNLIATPNQAAANGNAVLVITYSDGSQGTLGIGCHGPGAPNAIVEGVIATKGYVTYWSPELPTPNADANRTSFQVRKKAQ